MQINDIAKLKKTISRITFVQGVEKEKEVWYAKVAIDGFGQTDEFWIERANTFRREELRRAWVSADSSIKVVRELLQDEFPPLIFQPLPRKA